MKKMKDIWEFNNKLLFNKKVIVYGTSKASILFAIKILNHDITFDYFLYEHEGEIANTRILNKEVISMHRLAELDKQRTEYVIITSYEQYEQAENVLKNSNSIKYLNMFETLNRTLLENNIIIYGAGKNSEEFLCKQGRKVKCEICDSDKEKFPNGEKFLGRVIVELSEKIEEDKNLFLLILSNAYQEIYHQVLSVGVKDENIYLDFDKFVHKGRIHICDNIYYWASRTGHSLKTAVYSLSITAKKKNIILYGMSKVVKKTKQKLEQLDIAVAYTLERLSMEEDGTIKKIMNMDLENCECILVDGFSEKTLELIETMDIDINIFRWLDNYSPYYSIEWDKNYSKAIDPILGYATIKDNEQYPGFIEYRGMNGNMENPVVIVTSGSSTTTGYWIQNCWSRYLSEILSERGISHCIYAGGIEAYSTGQELLKLIRDVIPMNPDMVISLNGINELAWMKIDGYSFHNKFYKKLCKQTLREINNQEDCLGKGFHKNIISYGSKDNRTNYEIWHDNNLMMKAVCASKNIIYKSFLEPCILTKKWMGDEDRNCLAALEIFQKEGTGELVYSSNQANVLRGHVLFEQNAKRYNDDFIIDLTGVFDKEDACYIDVCHVLEKGSRILADEIFKNIIEDINMIKERK